MKLRTLFVFALIICLSITQITPIFAERARISPFINYGENNTYKLSRYDVLNIVIVGHPDADMFNDIMVGIDGYVDLPYVGTIKLSGLTIDEARIMLTEKISEYLKNINLSIMIKEYGARQVYVMGEVKQQGVYNLSPTSMNIFAAITSAGGITRRGRPKHIAVVRMVDDELIMRKVNLDAFIKNQDVDQNVGLMDGDMIYVPKSSKVLLQEDIMPLASAYGIFRTITR